MFTLPADATDDDLRDVVSEWFRLIATGRRADAEAFLDNEDVATPLSVLGFESRVSELTGGGRITVPERFPEFVSVEDTIDGPAPPIVCRWVPGPKTTAKYPGFVADILHPIPVDGRWSDLDASFFVRAKDGKLSLQLREIIRLE